MPHKSSSRSQAKVPEWFLPYCFKDLEQLKQESLPITLADGTSKEDGSVQDVSFETSDRYSVHVAVLEPLHALISTTKLPTFNHDGGPRTSMFLNDAIYLRFAGKESAGGATFLGKVVKHYAQEIGGDLLRLDLDDLLDLAQHYEARPPCYPPPPPLPPPNPMYTLPGLHPGLPVASSENSGAEPSPQFPPMPNRMIEKKFEGISSTSTAIATTAADVGPPKVAAPDSVDSSAEEMANEILIDGKVMPLQSSTEKSVTPEQTVKSSDSPCTEHESSKSSLNAEGKEDTAPQLPPYLSISSPPPPGVEIHISNKTLPSASLPKAHSPAPLPLFPPPCPPLPGMGMMLPPPPPGFVCGPPPPLPVIGDCEAIPFKRLLSAVTARQLSSAEFGSRPLIIHLATSCEMLDFKEKKLLNGLQKAIRKCDADVLLIMTSHGAKGDRTCNDCDGSWSEISHLEEESDSPSDIDCDSDDSSVASRRSYYSCSSSERSSRVRRKSRAMQMLSSLSTRHRPQPIYLAPMSTNNQELLFREHTELEQSFAATNIRLLKRAMRKGAIDWTEKYTCRLDSVHFLQPSTEWDFIIDMDDHALLSKAKLPNRVVEDVLVTVKRHSFQQLGIQTAVRRMGEREAALKSWFNAAQASDLKWNEYPPTVRKAIARIERYNRKYKWEFSMLGNIVRRGTHDDQGWSGLAVDSEAQAALDRLVQQHVGVHGKSYGVLGANTVGTAILHGPGASGPDVARYIASQVRVPVLGVSAAEAEARWIEECENVAEGIFSLTQMIGPCIMVLHEADELIRGRCTDALGLERLRKSQFSAILERNKRAEKPCLFLLATQAPQKFDAAVLRRTPIKIQMDLPDESTMEQLLRATLADETLDESVDIGCLATQGVHYTASEIRSVCVKAALLCDDFDGDEPQRRVLKARHFEAAFAAIKPATLIEATAADHALADELDPCSTKNTVEEEACSWDGDDFQI